MYAAIQMTQPNAALETSLLQSFAVSNLLREITQLAWCVKTNLDLPKTKTTGDALFTTRRK